MKVLLALSTLIIVAACSSKPAAGNNRDTMTQRQKDSVFGASGVPGASAINQAQKAADSLDARRKRIDSAAAAAAKPDTTSSFQ